MNKINVVGIGFDGKIGLSDTVKAIIKNATVLAGASRHLSYFSEHPADKFLLQNFQDDIDSAIEKSVTEKVVILVSGDPLFFGLGRLLLTKIPAEKLQFYPHLSSIQLAFNQLKISWQDAAIVSVHGRNCEKLIKHFKKGTEKIAVLTDNYNSPIAIAKLYLSLEIPVAYSFFVCENLTVTDGKISAFNPSEIIDLANLNTDKFATLNVLVLIKKDAVEKELDLANLPLLGIPDSAFFSYSDRPSLITKKEVRSVILGELALQPQQTVWDIGAGTGSVSIEIARLCPLSNIYAIEKTAMGVSLIDKNIKRFAVKNIQVISAKAPESLEELPTPNRIFIGGSGGNLGSILDTCQKKIATQGIIIIALATIEHFITILEWANQNNWHYRILQVQISRSIPIANLTRFSPLNPVQIIKLEKIGNS